MGELAVAVRHNGWKAARRAPIALLSLWLVFVVELLSRSGWGDALGWTYQALPQMLLNGLIVIGIWFLLTAIAGSVGLSFWLVASICLIFGMISGIKQKILGVPFLPWDLFLTSETKDMTQYVTGLLNFPVISGYITFTAISIVLLYRVPRMTVKLKLNWKRRVTMGLGSIVLLLFIYNDGTVSLRNLAHVQNLAWDQSENVKTNGLLLSTTMNIKFLFKNKPDGYDEETIKAITSTIHPAVAKEGEVKPNIIVVLSESFWDATEHLKNVTFSKDPLPFYHSLLEKYSHGTMVTPQFGGGTANVEFEVLTGNSMRFLPQGSIPYNQYIDKGIDSMASILSRQGYATTAINPFHSWFYNSKFVYENLGFSKFISQEFFEPDYEGPYLADRSVAKYIMESSKSTPGPDFIFANTMENHYHYYPGKFKENTIEVTGLTGESQGLLETYAQGLLGVDDMLKRLVTYYEHLDEPTIIVFFGDHLPSLGDDYRMYKDSGYLKENDPDFQNKMYRVPLLIWNNYLPKEPKKALDMNTSFLGTYVLEMAQRPGSYYTDFLYQMFQRDPVLPANGSLKAKFGDDSLKAYEKLQYDIMFGEQYAYDGIKKTIKKPNYVLGLGELAIQGARLETTGSGKQLTVSGANIPYGAQLTVNGQPVASQWIGTNRVSAAITPEQAAKGPLKLKMTVKDSKEVTIAQSNEYSLSPMLAQEPEPEPEKEQGNVQEPGEDSIQQPATDSSTLLLYNEQAAE